MIRFQAPPERSFEACLAPSIKPLPERLKSMARELFLVWTEYLVFGTSRKPVWSISGSWPKTIARTVQKHGARTIFESGPNIWFLEPPESRFEAFLVPGPKLLPERLKNMARDLFLDLDRICGFWNLQKSFWSISGSWPQTIAKTVQKYGARAIFRSGQNIWFFVSKETYEIMFTEKGQHRNPQWTIGSKMRKVW